MPGTAYVLFHHVMGEAARQREACGATCAAAWAGSTQALAACRPRPRRRHPLRRRGGAHPRARRTGRRRRRWRAATSSTPAIVASNADAHVTFLQLIDRNTLPPAFVADVERISYSSASLKINVALAELPSFQRAPGHEPGPQHRGTIHICPDQDYIERAFDDAKYGRPSAQPGAGVHDSLGGGPDGRTAGRHLMSMFVQYAPYELRDGSWDDKREAFADRCFDLLGRVRTQLQGRSVARPAGADAPRPRARFQPHRRQHLPGRDDSRPALRLPPRPRLRALPDAARGLYLCGAATHPGGGVMGTPGLNAAREILGQRRLRASS